MCEGVRVCGGGGVCVLAFEGVWCLCLKECFCCLCLNVYMY